MTVLTVASIAPRDGRACAHCGATEGLSIQHRANKGMGGSKVKGERKSNGVILCAVYNASLEQNADHAMMARQFGWKVSKYTDPSTVPFWHAPTGVWWMADDHGQKRPATPEEVEAHLVQFTPF